MLKSLHVWNGIKHKDRVFNFEKGLTTITGKNGAGKSLIQEFIRFALFGISALRGKVSDYDTAFRVELLCNINNEEIKIDRTLKGCVINDVVVGTTECNKYIIDKLGYNISVFDMGNCAKQFEINKLGEMKPSERKTAIDQVIGLTAVTKLIKELKEERNQIKSYVEGCKSVLIEPIVPEKPEGYRDSTELNNFLNAEWSKIQEYNICKGNADILKCDEPICNFAEPPVGDLRNENLHKMLIEKMKNFTEEDKQGSQYSSDELRNWLFASNLWSTYTEPEIELDQIENGLKEWSKYREYHNSKKAVCPKCGEEFSLSGLDKVEIPSLAEDYLNEQKKKHLSKPSMPKPDTFIDINFVTKEEQKSARQRDYISTKEQLERFGDVDYDKLREYNIYKTQLNNYEKYCECLNKIKELGTIEDENYLESLKSLSVKCEIYENDLRRYEIAKTEYDNRIKMIEEKEEKINKLNSAIEGLSSLMSRVKNSIIPSLSSVSTNLVREMSNFDITNIEISEDFDILVDGKELCLLSGSEKAVANLAIRLALSSILTRKVFNVFMGDEIDESMSEERANSTAETLHKLTDQIEQILLISHRNITGDNNIEI